MNHLRELVEQTNFEYEGHKISVRISIGVTGNHSKLQSVYTMLKEADKNLYIAKTTGRNKVVY
jgi:diguanylate cyclase (GGDEF)-like protein